ncbi:proton-conducting transporter membrane subunit [Arcobacter sp. LA11]|uniref:proton-conducting transporter transmembrane domain-containing protein n=1 Tax=Arcobacter sp. LA11 TaxID=1898176 RepID=UPI0009327F01|nr:proton-conducting transporter membrane subunit [Arcobacter sp. LA11]
MSIEVLYILILLIPLLTAVGVLVCHKNENIRESVTLIGGVSLFLVVVTLAFNYDFEKMVTVTLLEPFPDLSIALRLEPLGLIFALVAGFLWPVTSLYAIGYMRSHHEKNQTRFYTAFAISIFATMAIALSANLLTLFLAYEMLTLFTLPLVTHAGTDAARRAGWTYLGILMTTSIGFLLLAIIWTWSLTGTLEFTAGGILAGKAEPAILGGLLLLFVFGTGKAALMPFHKWLPAAMVAPTPVSSLLHAVAVVKAGVFTILKVAVYIFGIDLVASLDTAYWLSLLAGFTILSASIIAMTKDNLKARLAYSTISQLSYIILAAMLGVATGVLAGSLHIAMHAFAKITLFFCAGAILVSAHKTKVSELNGIGRAMPITMLAFLLAALSIVGLPPLGGSWSKWLLLQATMEAHNMVLLMVLLVSSLLNLFYLVEIPLRGFFAKPVDPSYNSGIKEAPKFSLIAILITTTGCLALFFLVNPAWNLVEKILP